MLQTRIASMLSALGVIKRLLPDIVTGMLKVFSLYVYALLDPGATLSFVTPPIANKFDIYPTFYMNLL